MSDADLEAKYQEIADMRGQRVEAIRGYFKKDNAVEELRKRILEERTLEWLLEASELVAPTGGEAPAAEAPAVEAPAAEAPAKKTKAKAKKDEPAVEAAAEEAPAAEEAAPKKARASKKKSES